MALAKPEICVFGWKAHDFALKGVDGKTYTLADARGSKGTLVVFICNHCPYVKASIGRIVTEAKALREIGIGTIAIMPNDTEAAPSSAARTERGWSSTAIRILQILMEVLPLGCNQDFAKLCRQRFDLYQAATITALPENSVLWACGVDLAFSAAGAAKRSRCEAESSS